ncbi:DUF6612 family protein [Chloroflexota bacterium]
MRQKILTMSLVLIMVLLFISCDEGQPSSQEIVDRVNETVDKLNTFGFDLDMNASINAEAEGEGYEMTFIVSSEGLLDTQNKQTEMELDLDLSVTRIGIIEQEMSMGIDMGMYLMDNMAYIKMEDKETGPVWGKSEIPEEVWQELSEQMIEPLDMAKLLTELLEVTKVDVIGNEVIRGIDCYVLQFNLDIDKLWQKSLQLAEETDEEIPPDFNKESFRDIFNNVSIKQWIAKDTYFITKLEIDADIEIIPEEMGFTTDEEGLAAELMALDMTINLIVYDHNQPVSIVLPQEAEEAGDMMDVLTPILMQLLGGGFTDSVDTYTTTITRTQQP